MDSPLRLEQVRQRGGVDELGRQRRRQPADPRALRQLHRHHVVAEVGDGQLEDLVVGVPRDVGQFGEVTWMAIK